jgi:hypothetical protein
MGDIRWKKLRIERRLIQSQFTRAEPLGGTLLFGSS